MSALQVKRLQDNPNKDLIRRFIVGYAPTKADLDRKLSTKDLKELCRRVKCKVDLSRWNAVDDCLRYLECNGYLENKTEHKVKKLLIKAINRYKNTALYTDEVITSVLQQEWAYRKKENLLRLDLWAYDRERAQLKACAPVSQYPEIEQELERNSIIVTHEKQITTDAESGVDEPQVEDVYNLSQIMDEFLNSDAESLCGS